MKHILLIDDEEDELVFIRFLLKDRYKDEFALFHADSIDAAQSLFLEHRIDVILLDDRLKGGLTSADTIPQLQRMAFNVPIIIVSKDIDGRHLKDRARLGKTPIVDKFKFRSELADGLLDTYGEQAQDRLSLWP